MNKLLVVEDNKAMREMLVNILLEKGYEVKSAETVSCALLLLKSEYFHLIISDLQLPDMDGMAVLKELKSWAKFPVIIVSVRDSEQDIIAALDSGADDYLTKPFSPKELRARIRAVLRRADDQRGVSLAAGGQRREPGRFRGGPSPL